MSKYQKISVVAAQNNDFALQKKDFLINKFGFKDFTNSENIENTDLIIAIGGDGLMLRLLHKIEKNPIPVYGVNCGTVGFLMNSFDENILEKISIAQTVTLNPLRMEVVDLKGEKHTHIAINEVALIRQSNQASKIKIEINSKERLNYLIADGVLVSSSAGSTAYNFSAGGSIIPFGAKIFALTAISPFRPRKWNGALLPSNSKIKFEILEADNRPVSATADSREVRNVKEVLVFEDSSLDFKLMFDPNHSLEERIIGEQFSWKEFLV